MLVRYFVIAVFSYVLSLGAARATDIGIWAGPGCDGLPHLTSYATWLGSPAKHVTENFSQDTWSDLASDATWSIGCYKQVQATTNLTFSIPMLPADGSSTLAAGAAGAYDSYFTTIAKTLIANGFATATIRIGWEFNGDWQPWSAVKDPVDYVKFFQKIVWDMRGMPGAKFKFEWCPNIGTNSIAPSHVYPGDGFVDIIGMDVYDGHYSTVDATPTGRWNWFLTEPYGLQWQVKVAKAHKKAISIAEWGCCGADTGDDPYFVTQMAAWLKANNYLYADYWDSNESYPGMLSENQYPLAAAAYIAAFK